MLENMTEEEFFKHVDKVIACLNSIGESVHIGNVSAIAMYASARYSAFVYKSNNGTDHDVAMKYFEDQFKKMLKENLSKIA